jgi:hypothetical protein
MLSIRPTHGRWFSARSCGIVCALALGGASCSSPAVVIVPPPCPVMTEAAVDNMNWQPSERPFLELWISEMERFCDSLDTIIERYLKDR